MFGFVKNWLRHIYVNSARKDMQIFLDGLKFGDKDQVGLIVAYAAVFKVNLEANGLQIGKGLGEGTSPLSDAEISKIPVQINRLIRDSQRVGRNDAAAGMMVWLQSYRALNIPEIKPLAYEMWKELSRGHESAQAQYEVFKSMGYLRIVESVEEKSLNFRFAPKNLEQWKS